MLRPLIILTCFSLLTYQTYYLINDYREFSTVVNIKIVKAKISDHPSVSICYINEEEITLLLNAIKWTKQNEREYPFASKFNQMFQEILNNEKLSASEKRNTLFNEGLIMFYVELAKRNLTKVAKMRFWIEFDGFPGKKMIVIAMQSTLLNI
jgi:Amiloride-sensitive sodium channel